jgi:precorrin-2 dehydrogenase/sirohydrochlorin ferrochelatase
MMADLYPLFLDLKGKKCLVIGGGRVAERKVKTLLQYGGNVKVVSPVTENSIELWAEQGLIELEKREFAPTDLDDIFLVFIATNNPDLNGEVSRLCRENKILVNAVDDPPNCDFFVPAIIKRNSLVLAISTGGKSPAFARKLRQELEQMISSEYGEFVDLIGEQRDFIKERIASIEDRKKLFEELVNSDILDLLMAGEKERAREKVNKCISLWLD